MAALVSTETGGLCCRDGWYDGWKSGGDFCSAFLRGQVLRFEVFEPILGPSWWNEQ